ncbi:ClpXP protease specificity-enhancing factor SspB [Hyphobacterium sp. Y6023]|uniref:ClpXP protease specificity-enhancing factor SspB n=2 Tax=Hyphobacterium marinum TaxID=3116574 RepID=A0ABU7M117_9PROT|nr:ClpXP protease specificity-enhancing factor SspB [Hyphobacterium sp. Y6023]MEE2566955.1 ClpXP protease specificity-enhancing factor SspB [Hyphobacterium sp. Y6023]
MAKDLMRYDIMAQEALRGVIREALGRAAAPGGLPGSHHFYISFKTQAPGTDIDESLAAKYPDEMTIVLEHQFWDLKADEEHFEVTLKFNGVPKYLKVPYSAVNRFHDPSVGFHLQFELNPDDGSVPRFAPKETKAKPAKESAAAAGDGAEVVSLDSFRKK